MKNRNGVQARINIILVVVIGLLSACTDQAALKPVQATDTATALPSTTLLPTFTPTVTSTPLSPDAQALKDIVFSDCIPVGHFLPEDLEFMWDLLIMQNEVVFIYAFEAGTKTEVPHFTEIMPRYYYMYLEGLHVSPNGKWLAYIDESHSKLIVEPVETLLNNIEENRIVWDMEDWFSIEHWVDNNKLLAIYRPIEESGFSQTVFLNPFTREEYLFLLETLPNYLSSHFSGALYSTHYIFEGEVVPDPTMKRLIYPEIDISDPSILATNTLWDIENQQPLARLRFLTDTVNAPLWAQDGNDVLMLGPNPEPKQIVREEWFLINANGEIRQITQFQDVFHDVVYFISKSSRSQDGRFLTFELYYEEPEKTQKYLVLDLKSSVIEGFCTPSLGQSSFRGPKWSPDSRYFIISGDNIDGKVNNILVDAENRTSYTIAQDMEVIGWIVKP